MPTVLNVNVLAKQFLLVNRHEPKPPKNHGETDVIVRHLRHHIELLSQTLNI